MVGEAKKRIKIWGEIRGGSKAPSDEREVYRILSWRYSDSPVGLPPKEVIRRMRTLFTYRHYSDHQMRRLIRSVLRDPSIGRFLEVSLNAPTDWVLGEAIKSTLPNLREVIVIPTLDPISSSDLPNFLGKTAAKVFTPRFLGGQCIGLGYGPAIHSFVKSLNIPPFLANHLRFESLIFCPDTRFWGTGSENLFELVANHISNSDEQLKAFIRPNHLTADELHWVFVEINPIDERLTHPPFSLDLKSVLRRNAVAEILGQFVDRNGALLPSTGLSIHATPLTVLKEMVRNGRGVVALAGGVQSVHAILAAYKAGLFNYLVTDELCAETLLKSQHPGWRVSSLPYRDEWWERKQHFYVAFMRYGQPTLCHTIKDIARRLTLSPKRVRALLDNLHKGGSHEPMIIIRVKAPSSEMDLEMHLIRTFGLSEARVVPTEGDVTYALGNSAAQLFWELVRGRTSFTVGIGSGKAIKAMMKSLKLLTTVHKFHHLKSLNFWALNTNPLPEVLGLSAETILASVAMEWLLSCGVSGVSTIQFHTYRGGQPLELDAAFVELDDISIDEIATKVQRKLVQEGKPVIIIAKGAEKASALLSAYRSNLFNSLVVDRHLAETLLNQTFRL